MRVDARGCAVGKGWANPLQSNDLDLHVGELRETGIARQERVGAGLDGAREVDGVGDLEAWTGAKVSSSVEHGGGHVEEDEFVCSEDLLVLVEERAVVVAKRLHSTFEASDAGCHDLSGRFGKDGIDTLCKALANDG